MCLKAWIFPKINDYTNTVQIPIVRLRKVVRPLRRAQNMVISISTCHVKLPLAPWYSALLGRLKGSALMSNSSIVTKLSNCSHYFQTQLYCLQPSGHTNYQSEPLLGRGDGSADNRRMSASLTEQLGLFFSSIVVSSSSVKYKGDTEIYVFVLNIRLQV